MTVAYFDCFSGISGDMALGALIDAGGEPAVLDATVEALGLQAEVRTEVRREARGHVTGTRVLVRTAEDVDRTVPALRGAVQDSSAPDAVKRQALAAVDVLARAESRLHGATEEDLHLHELGGADTLVDLVGVFWLLQEMGIQRVLASELPAPRGRKDGMPLPPPASMRVLEGTGAVIFPVDEQRELVTPTGAAILAASATFERPPIELHRVGYGIGTHPAPGNVLAVWIGEASRVEIGVTVLETNLDDMAPNLVAALCEDLMHAGALDVTVTPAVMKKGRPGHVVAVMSPPELVAALTEHLLRHSTTLGVRMTPVQRTTAGRRVVEVRTALGLARVKVKELGARILDVTPEYEDCRRISRETGRDLREVMREVDAAARKELGLR